MVTLGVGKWWFRFRSKEEKYYSVHVGRTAKQATAEWENFVEMARMSLAKVRQSTGGEAQWLRATLGEDEFLVFAHGDKRKDRELKGIRGVLTGLRRKGQSVIDGMVRPVRFSKVRSVHFEPTSEDFLSRGCTQLDLCHQEQVMFDMEPWDGSETSSVYVLDLERLNLENLNLEELNLEELDFEDIDNLELSTRS
uniref:Uncharacterized protein n=1 Tax=Compsopogon caeruleus TaxID=31354 RepID=A0A7S1THC3_9RHOD|mmetsp:Transcript_7708/g.15588  ORF Transcript_7708/g.15588 Transcript_7708/m.15588 type:complete len:195 (+) Transcript_7708:313-897(+)|eukprot:CAMPEP_0184679190 /NCGR_PEP_ID=MMETSP0312-20130426/2013_1 /TAXON_ID=31354 /ORGANISM="Compsopogon coeruleus, Strain SAG 36.94" /LENGTH=194 /DNA_ID=CAMNT_0027128479 /DNA_START=285 /DNA_END=869 /DNA_ORIENTATION=+